VTNLKSSVSDSAVLEAELDKFRQHADLLDQTELVAHIGHYEWSYALDSLLSCSEEYARIHDMTIDEMLVAHSSRARVIAQVHPEDREQFLKIDDTLSQDKSMDIRLRIILDSGEVRHVRKSAIEVDDENGDAIGTFGILQDISDQVKHERDLEYRDELARQTETVTDIGHFIYDEENERYVYLSDGCARIYGSTVEDYMAKNLSVEDDLADVVAEDRDRVAEEYRQYIETGQDCAIEFRIKRADGSLRWHSRSLFLSWEKTHPRDSSSLSRARARCSRIFTVSMDISSIAAISGLL